MLGLQPPTHGEVYFEGALVPARRGAHWRALRRRMQMVYQDPLGALDRRLPVLSQVAEPLLVFGQDSALERNAQARELMQAVGLTPHLFDRYPHELSGGQRQRVLLALELLHADPDQALLIGDSHLDALCAQRSGVGFVWYRNAYAIGEVLQHPVSASFSSYAELEPGQRAYAADAVPRSIA